MLYLTTMELPAGEILQTPMDGQELWGEMLLDVVLGFVELMEERVEEVELHAVPIKVVEEEGFRVMGRMVVHIVLLLMAD